MAILDNVQSFSVSSVKPPFVDYIFIALGAIQQIMPQAETVLLYDLFMTGVTGAKHFKPFLVQHIPPGLKREVSGVGKYPTRQAVQSMGSTSVCAKQPQAQLAADGRSIFYTVFSMVQQMS
ncbi:hypothetical protein [Desulfosarcina sp.]|uniref:hypothetical protein n=1 Tax=Desulfosarcina sp. TaxID=2027861 RepID=UPI00356A0C11